MIRKNPSGLRSLATGPLASGAKLVNFYISEHTRGLKEKNHLSLSFLFILLQPMPRRQGD